MLRSQILYELDRVVHNDPAVQVEGPVILCSENRELSKCVETFRRDQYKKKAPYLNDSFQQSIERRLQLDRRGLHFLAHYKGKLVAGLRVTPPPFEMEMLSNELRRAVWSFPRFLELGRLLVDERYQGVGLGKKLLYQAMIYACRDRYRGFLAVCRKEKAIGFQRFGMRAFKGKAFPLESRQNEPYFLMWGTWNRFFLNLVTYYGGKRLLNKIQGKPLHNWKPLTQEGFQKEQKHEPRSTPSPSP